MARSTLTDVMQNYAFWLFDVAPVDPVALPIFTPLTGFSAISAPELSAEMYEVAEANWYYRKKVFQKGDVSSITLSRGVRWHDSDFWSWMISGVTGTTGGSNISGSGAPSPLQAQSVRGGITPRRNLMLIHFLSRSPLSAELTAAAAVAGLSAGLGTATSVGGGGALTGATAALRSGGGVGPFQFAPRLPGRAWMLYGCLPQRYRAGSDFEASSGEVSIQELEIAVERFDEITLSR